jgi:hypothetical protein
MSPGLEAHATKAVSRQSAFSGSTCIPKRKHRGVCAQKIPTPPHIAHAISLAEWKYMKAKIIAGVGQKRGGSELRASRGMGRGISLPPTMHIAARESWKEKADAHGCVGY